MDLKKISLRSQILLMVISSGLITATLFALFFAFQQREVRLQEFTSNLNSTSERLETILSNASDSLRRNVIYLSGTPPIQGIIRSIQNDGIDPVDNSTLELWKQRLQTIFASISSINPEYFQICYIGAADNGLELVRLNSLNAEIQIVEETELQEKGDRGYFLDTQALPAGEVYFSQLSLNQENDIIETPYRPTLRAAVPIYTEQNVFFGIVIINLDINTVFEEMQAVVDTRNVDNLQLYITNESDEYLYHSEADRAFAFDFGRSDRFSEEFSELVLTDTEQAVLASQSSFLPEMSLLQGQLNSADYFIYPNHINILRDNGELNLTFSLIAPTSSANLSLLPLFASYWITTVAAGIIILFFLIILVSKQLRPLRSLSSEANKIAEGHYDIKLPEANSVEIDKLIQSFASLERRVRIRETELVKSKDEATRLLQAKTDFLSNMSHEIRTPMTAILGLLDILRNTELNKSQQQYVFQIHSSTRSLLRIINDILDISKIEAGKISLESLDFSLLEVLEGSVDLFAPSADLKGINLHLSMDSGISKMLIGDRTRLTQVLNNILGNAIKFTSIGEVILSAKIIKESSNSIRIRFKVSDTGIGISSEAIAKLFNAFEQADTSTTRLFGGSGLGLTISYKLVELMDGQLQVESIQGKGSDFWFDLPFPLSQQPEHKLTSIADIKKNVLVVDDQPISCEILSEMLTHWGCKVFSANSGPEALKKITQDAEIGKQYDFMIVDWRMPEMDGFQLIEKVHALYTAHEITYDPPVLMVTGAENKELEESDSYREDIEVLVKPITVSKLLNILSEMDLIKFVIEDDADSQRKVLEQELRTKISAMPSPPRILLVEDNFTNQTVIKELLSAYKINLLIADNGLEAVNMVKAEEIDLVLMDLQMPIMDGFDATIEIRKFKSASTLPILALSAAIFSEDIEQSTQAGMNAHLHKPIEMEKLLSALLQWIPFNRPETAGKTKLAASAAEDSGPSAGNNGISQYPEILSTFDGDPDFDFSGTILKSNGPSALIRIMRSFHTEFSQVLSGWSNDADWNSEYKLRLAHSLKGAASSIGAITLAHQAAQTEQELRADESTDIGTLVNQLHSVVNKLSGLLD